MVSFKFDDLRAKLGIILENIQKTKNAIEKSYPEKIIRRPWRIGGLHNRTLDGLYTAIDFLIATADHFSFAGLAGAVFPLITYQETLRQARESGALRISLVP